jgi:hypothetical protein
VGKLWIHESPSSWNLLQTTCELKTVAGYNIQCSAPNPGNPAQGVTSPRMLHRKARIFDAAWKLKSTLPLWCAWVGHSTSGGCYAWRKAPFTKFDLLLALWKCDVIHYFTKFVIPSIGTLNPPPQAPHGFNVDTTSNLHPESPGRNLMNSDHQETNRCWILNEQREWYFK